MEQRRSLVEGRPIPGRIAARRAILESWCYTRRDGAASIRAESRLIPGNSRWCSAWLGSREGGDVSSYTSGSKRWWCDPKSFVYTRVAWWTADTRSKLRFCLYQVTSKIFCLYQVTSKTSCLYQVTSKTSCLYQVTSQTFCLYHVVFFYSHQRPWGGKRLGGRYMPVERL